MMRILIRLVFILTIACNGDQAFGQKSKNPLKKQSIFQYIQNQPTIRIELSANLDSLLKNKLSPYETKGRILLQDDSTLLSMSVKVTVRGKFRRRTCDFPPLLLDFPKDDLKDAGFKKSDKYKLVTHCLNTKNAKTYLLKEYLIYKLYQELDSTGYGVSLFPITYRDVDSGREFDSYGFLIESNSELKDRLGGKWCDCLGIHTDSINPYYKELVHFFQYMIGNRDMNMHIEHNVRFIEGGPFNMKVPIPYDFDFSDFVKTPYAFPDQSVTFDRSTLALGKDEDQFEKVLSLFLQKKEAFLSIINNFDLLPKRHRRKSRSFVRDFYRLIDRPFFKKHYLQS